MGDVESISFFVPGRPVPFARAGSNGKRRYTPAKQAAYMALVQDVARAAMGTAGMVAPFFDAPLQVTCQATYDIPASWSKAQRAAASWKTSVPDSDNLYKLLADAMNKIVFADDALIARVVIEKRFGQVPGSAVTVSLIPDMPLAA